MTENNCLPDFSNLCSKDQCQQINSKLDTLTQLVSYIQSKVDQTYNEVMRLRIDVEIIYQNIVLPNTAFVNLGECEPPEEEGDWYNFKSLEIIQPSTLAEMVNLISRQITDLHKDNCKSIIPKSQLDDVPPFLQCEEDEEGKKKMSIVDTSKLTEPELEEMGLVPATALPWIGKQLILPYLTEKFLDHFVNKALPKQTEENGNLICQISSGDCSTLADDRTTWKSFGYYLEFKWKWEDTTIKSNPNSWFMRSPIEDLISPSNPETVWGYYFSNIYYIVGNTFSSFYTQNALGEEYKFALMSGNFESHEEAERFFTSIKNLCSEIARPINNPRSVVTSNQQSNIVYIGKKKVLRCVNVVVKLPNTNQTQLINTYAPPKP